MSDRPRYERFVALPSPRFLRDPRVRPRHKLMALLLVDTVDRRTRVVELHPSRLAGADWGYTGQHARDTLRDLRAWSYCDFEDPVQGQQRPWRVTLTGLWLVEPTSNSEASTSNSEAAVSLKLASNSATSNSRASAGVERDWREARPQTDGLESPSTSRPISEGKYDQDLGKGTGTDSNDALFAALAEIESGKRDWETAAERARCAEAKRKTRESYERLPESERLFVAELVETFDAVLVEEQTP